MAKDRSKSIIISKKEVTQPFVVNAVKDYCEKHKCTQQECIMIFIKKGILADKKEKEILAANGFS